MTCYTIQGMAPHAAPINRYVASTPEVTIVLPAYRAADVLARNVPPLLDYLNSLAFTHEVIVVDDGSQDHGRTGDVARKLGCRYMELPRNVGKGAAVRQGMLAASGRFRIFTDADVPFELDAIERILYYLDFKEFHFVTGDRTLPDSRYFAQVSIARRLASATASTIISRFIAGGWLDTQCGIKGFQGCVADDLFGVTRVRGFAFDVELFYVALKRNYDIKRIPIRLRSNDTSSVRLAIDGPSFVVDLARIKWNQVCGRYRPRTHGPNS